MSWELQIKVKKDEWMKIQEKRTQLDLMKKQYKDLGSNIKSLGQKIPKLLDKFKNYEKL